jgi:hypothetical protein
MAKDDDNPFGEPPSTDPFGRPISGDEPYVTPQPAQTGGASSPADPWSQGPAAPPPAEPWSQGPPAPPPAPGYAVPAGQKVDGAIPALILGIIGLIFCQILAPIAWVLGRNAERKVDASGGALSGRGEATAGKVLGIIGTVLLVLGIIFIIVVIGLGASVEGGDGGTTTTFEF